jgi:hypothetical protein
METKLNQRKQKHVHYEEERKENQQPNVKKSPKDRKTILDTDYLTPFELQSNMKINKYVTMSINIFHIHKLKLYTTNNNEVKHSSVDKYITFYIRWSGFKLEISHFLTSKK